MPKGNKKRGRREDQKKCRREQSEHEPAAQCHKNGAWESVDTQHKDESCQNGTFEGVSRSEDMPLYGMLDEEERAHFKQADETLELDQFDDAEGRTTFLASVWKETEGKEPKDRKHPVLLTVNGEADPPVQHRAAKSPISDIQWQVIGAFRPSFQNFLVRMYCSTASTSIFIPKQAQ